MWQRRIFLCKITSFQNDKILLEEIAKILYFWELRKDSRVAGGVVLPYFFDKRGDIFLINNKGPGTQCT